MSDKSQEISVGDMVQVVRGTPCCNNQHYLGFTFTVEAIAPISMLSCHSCHKRFPSGGGLYEPRAGLNTGFVRSELIKIAPKGDSLQLVDELEDDTVTI